MKIFQLAITSAISKGEKHGTIHVIPMPAYLLFYEKCAEQEVQEIRYLSKESHHSEMPKAEDNAVCEERAQPTKFCIPPGYYKKPSKSFQAGVSPGIYKTAKGNKAWQYSRVDGALIGKAEAIAMAGVQVPQHPRIKGWDPSDVERLLPVEMKVTDGKLSNFLVNQVFLMIEQHSQAILHNGSQIRVQPTSISRRKSGNKSSTAQPSGRHLKLSTIVV